MQEIGDVNTFVLLLLLIGTYYRPDGLTWCPVYKAASTTWLNIMCRLAGVKESTLVKSKEQVSHVARRLWPELDYEDALQVQYLLSVQ